MDWIRNNFMSAIAPTVLILVMLAFPSVTLAAQTPLTNDEYKSLLDIQEFEKAEQSLAAAYIEYLATAKNEAEKKEIIQSHLQWVALRKKEAGERFKKKSPAYVQFMIDWATHQTDTLHRVIAGRPETIKADGYFDTLDYDAIPYDGIINPEHRMGGSPQKIVPTNKIAPKADRIEWLSTAEAAKMHYSLMGYTSAPFQTPRHPTYLLPHDGAFGGCRYDERDVERYYKCVYSLCSLMIQGSYDKSELLLANYESAIGEFIKMCPQKVASAKVAYDQAKEKERREAEAREARNKAQREVELAAQQARLDKIKALEKLAESYKDIAVSRIKDSRPSLFAESSYPTMGKAFEAFFGAPKKWKGDTHGSGGRDIVVSFEGIAMFNDKKAKFVIWFTDIDPELVRDNKPFSYNISAEINGVELYDNTTIGNLFAAIYLNN